MRQPGISFEEEKASLADLGKGERFHRWAAQLSATARVPVLEDEDRRVWDSLAIIEYLPESYPDTGSGQPSAAQPREPAPRAQRCMRASQPCAAASP